MKTFRLDKRTITLIVESLENAIEAEIGALKNCLEDEDEVDAQNKIDALNTIINQLTN